MRDKTYNPLSIEEKDKNLIHNITELFSTKTNEESSKIALNTKPAKIATYRRKNNSNIELSQHEITEYFMIKIRNKKG